MSFYEKLGFEVVAKRSYGTLGIPVIAMMVNNKLVNFWINLRKLLVFWLKVRRKNEIKIT